MTDAHEIITDLQDQFEQRAKAGDYDPQLNDFMTNEVVPVWQDNSPIGTKDDPHPGEYRDSVQVTQAAHAGQGQVGATSETANIIEYGSERSPEFAPRAKTQMHFNSSDSGVL